LRLGAILILLLFIVQLISCGYHADI